MVLHKEGEHVGTGFMLAGEGDDAGSGDADRWAALWHMEDTTYGLGAAGLEGLVTGDLVDHAAPIEPRLRDAGHIGASLTVADLPDDMRYQA